MDAVGRLVDRYGAAMDASQGSELTPVQQLDLIPIKWMYASDNFSGEGGRKGGVTGAAPQDEAVSGIMGMMGAAAGAAAGAVGKAARAGAHRNPFRALNVHGLPGARDEGIYLVFTHLTGRHSAGIYVTKEEAIQIVNWFINILVTAGTAVPFLEEQGGGGRRRKRKSHKRKSHKRKSRGRKRTRRRR